MTAFAGAVDATFAAFGIDAVYTPAAGNAGRPCVEPCRSLLSSQPGAQDLPGFEALFRRSRQIAGSGPRDRLSVRARASACAATGGSACLAPHTPSPIRTMAAMPITASVAVGT